MKDRVPGAPGQYKAQITASEFEKLKNEKEFSIVLIRDDHPLAEGTPYSKEAVLPDKLAAIICPEVEDPTPADALMGVFDITRKAAPVNMLDNSDFRNPVNQRGQTSYIGPGYTIDRWKADGLEEANVTGNVLWTNFGPGSDWTRSQGITSIFDESAPSRYVTKVDVSKTVRKDWFLNTESKSCIRIIVFLKGTDGNKVIYIPAEQLAMNNDGEYHTYRIKNVVLIPNEATSAWRICLFADGQLYNDTLPQTLFENIKGKAVDVYLTMKYTGDISGADTSNYPVYYIDELRVVDPEGKQKNKDVTVTLEKGGLHVSGGVDAPNSCNVCQIIDATKMRGKTFTLAVKNSYFKYITSNVTDKSCKISVISDYAALAEAEITYGAINTCTFTVPDNTDKLYIYIGNQYYNAGYGIIDILLEWVALYEGEYTAETLPKYHPKGYGVELAECLRYFQEIRALGGTDVGSAQVTNYNWYPMRIVPTYTLTKIAGEGTLNYFSVLGKSVGEMSVKTGWLSYVVSLSADL